MERTKPKRDIFKEMQTALRIDRNALEDECEAHPELFYEVTSHLQMMISERDALKQELQELDAKVDADIRNEAATIGEKITENDIKGKKTLDEAIIGLQQSLLDANEQVGKWAALKEAYQSRGYVLRDLVQLHLSQYYGQATDQITGRIKNTTAEYAKRELARARRER